MSFVESKGSLPLLNPQIIESRFIEDTQTRKTKVECFIPVVMWADQDQITDKEGTLKIPMTNSLPVDHKRKHDEMCGKDEDHDLSYPISSQVIKKVNVGPPSINQSANSSQKGVSQQQQQHNHNGEKLHRLLFKGSLPENKFQEPTSSTNNLSNQNMQHTSVSKYKKDEPISQPQSKNIEPELQIVTDKKQGNCQAESGKGKKEVLSQKKQHQKKNEPKMPGCTLIYERCFEIEERGKVSSLISITRGNFYVPKSEDNLKKIDKSYKMRFEGCDKKITKGYSREIHGRVILPVKDDWKKINSIFHDRRYNYLKTECNDMKFLITENPTLDEGEFDLIILERGDLKKSISNSQISIGLQKDPATPKNSNEKKQEVNKSVQNGKESSQKSLKKESVQKSQQSGNDKMVDSRRYETPEKRKKSH